MHILIHRLCESYLYTTRPGRTYDKTVLPLTEEDIDNLIHDRKGKVRTMDTLIRVKGPLQMPTDRKDVWA